jgi:hypothetical protein
MLKALVLTTKSNIAKSLKVGGSANIADSLKIGEFLRECIKLYFKFNKKGLP